MQRDIGEAGKIITKLSFVCGFINNLAGKLQKGKHLILFRGSARAADCQTAARYQVFESAHAKVKNTGKSRFFIDYVRTRPAYKVLIT